MTRPLLNLPVTPYSTERAALICDQLSKGVTLAAIIRNNPEMPSRWSIMAWRKSHPEFAEAYDAARDIGYDAIADEIIDIAEDGSADMTTRRNRNGEEYQVVDQEAVARSKLRIWSREKLLAVWSPRYRPQQGIQLSNPDGGPVQFTEASRAARVASLLALAARRKDGAKDDDGSDLV